MKSRKTKTIVLSISETMGQIVGIIVMMLMARYFTKDGLAAYRQTLMSYMLAAPLLQLGISQGIFYFLPTEKLRIRGRVVDSITILGVSGAVFALFIALGGNQIMASYFSNPRVASLLLWMIPYTLICIPSSIAGSVLVARDKVLKASIFQFSRQLFVGAATIIPILIWNNPETALIGNVVASVIFGIEALILMIGVTPKAPIKPQKSGMKEMLKFSVPLGVATMLGTISLQLDNLIVSVMCNPEEFAIYVLASTQIPLVGVVTGSIVAVLIVDMKKSVQKSDFKEAVRLFSLTAEKTSLIIFPMTVFLLVTAKPVILVLYTESYIESVYPFQLYLLKLPYRIVIFGAILMAFGQNVFILKRSGYSLLMGLVIKVILVYYMGYTGAVIGGLIVVYLYTIPSSMLKIQEKSNISWKKILPFGILGKRAIQCLPIAAISYVSLLITINLSAITQLIIAGIAVGPYCLWLWDGEIFDKNRLFYFIKSKFGNR